MAEWCCFRVGGSVDWDSWSGNGREMLGLALMIPMLLVENTKKFPLKIECALVIREFEDLCNMMSCILVLACDF